MRYYRCALCEGDDEKKMWELLDGCTFLCESCHEAVMNAVDVTVEGGRILEDDHYECAKRHDRGPNDEGVR